MAEQAPHTVLVVDDQEDSIALISRYLGNEGFRTLASTSGSNALDLVRTDPPDLILLDVIMPGMDGLEVCKTLKSSPDTMFIPVILVTTLESKSDRVDGLKAGADEFLSKPVNREELMTRVRSLIRLQEARDVLEQRRISEMKSTFSRYVSPKLVDQILVRPETAEEALRDKESRVGAVIMFADLRGFTKISEMLPAHLVVSMLNEFFSCLTEVVHAYDGTIFNMAGDSILVGFGVPFPQEDGPLRAVKCAASMQDAFEDLKTDWPQRYGVSGGMGVGINFGEVVVGNIGSSSYMNYTVIGDTVNLAARLTGCASSGEVIVSQSLINRLDGVADMVGFERLPPVEVKGKSDPQPIFKLQRRSAQSKTAIA